MIILFSDKLETQLLEIVCKDEISLKKFQKVTKQKLGELSINIASLEDDKPVTEWYKLKLDDSNDEVKIRLCLEVKNLFFVFL